VDTGGSQLPGASGGMQLGGSQLLGASGGAQPSPGGLPGSSQEVAGSVAVMATPQSTTNASRWQIHPRDSLTYPREQMLTVQNCAQVHRKPTSDLVPFSPRRVLPRFVNLRIGSKPLRFSI
jgi:hypothetical protein